MKLIKKELAEKMENTKTMKRRNNLRTSVFPEGVKDGWLVNIHSKPPLFPQLKKQMQQLSQSPSPNSSRPRDMILGADYFRADSEINDSFATDWKAQTRGALPAYLRIVEIPNNTS